MGLVLLMLASSLTPANQPLELKFNGPRALHLEPTVAGGLTNTAGNDYAAVGGGANNTSSGQFSTVPGGNRNGAAGDYSFAAGRRAKANHTGTFVWADATAADFASSAMDQFLIRANGVNPGISLSQQGVMEGGQNVAPSGRVYVQADASSGAIKPGDLLTTSATPGHAMNVAEPGKAQGAILGKAMSALAEGKGVVLVTLQ